MNDIVSLEKDNEKLEKYQAESLVGQLGVVQLHLEDMYSGKEAALCVDCLQNKHLPTIEVLANECLGICRIQPLWNNIAKWSRNFKDNKLNSDYIGKDNQNTLKLRNEARDFRKKLGVLLTSQKDFSGEVKMIEKRGVEDPNLGELANLDNPGKTAETKQVTKKKKGSTWPLLALVGGSLGVWYLWDKKKKAQAMEAARKEAEIEPQDTSLPPVAQRIVLPLETSGSAEVRLRGMGVNVDMPSPYQSDESYKEL